MDDLIELVVDVLKIADEYLMDRLKEICEKVLGEQGSPFDLFFFLAYAHTSSSINPSAMAATDDA